MLRVLTLSTLFPDATRPTFGVFVARQTQGLAGREGVAVEVVAPVGLPPLLGTRHPHWRALAGLPARDEWERLTVHRPRFATLPGLPALSPYLLARTLLPVLREIARRFPFDVIDAEFFFPDGPAAVWLGAKLGVPVSIKARGADIHLWGRARGTGPQVLRAGRRAAGLLAVSAAMKRDMVAIGLPEARIRVHYTGVDLDRFCPVADRVAAKRALGVTGPLLVSVGALIPRKNHDLAIAALRDLPEATLMIVGEGPERARLSALAAPLGDRVRLLGRRAHEDLPALLAAADASVLISASEGLANAWVESLACGTPVVCSAAGGARELIDRPAAGRVVAPEPQAIAAAVRDILAAPPSPAAVRASAERFTWAANAAALHAHLQSLVSPRRAG